MHCHMAWEDFRHNTDGFPGGTSHLVDLGCLWAGSDQTHLRGQRSGPACAKGPALAQGPGSLNSAAISHLPKPVSFDLKTLLILCTTGIHALKSWQAL